MAAPLRRPWPCPCGDQLAPSQAERHSDYAQLVHSGGFSPATASAAPAEEVTVGDVEVFSGSARELFCSLGRPAPLPAAQENSADLFRAQDLRLRQGWAGLRSVPGRSLRLPGGILAAVLLVASLLALVASYSGSRERRNQPLRRPADARGDGEIIFVAEGLGKAFAENDSGETVPGALEQKAIVKVNRNSQGNAEWKVVFAVPVPVRTEKDLASSIFTARKKGEIVVGEAEGEWVKLRDGAGYMRSTLNGVALLERRTASYEKISTGTCADAKQFPITDAAVCKAAVEALALPGIPVPSLAGCCAGDSSDPICSTQSYPIDPSAPTTTTSTWTPAMPPEVFQEWEVVWMEEVMVRDGMNLSSRILGTKRPGMIVVGELVSGAEEGRWLKLSHESGYMAVELPGKELLRERKAGYMRISRGSCREYGMYPIFEVTMCEVAATALGMASTSVTKVDSIRTPEGCYSKGNGPSQSLWLAEDTDMKGNGAIGARYPLCSTQAYPEPTSTTTTTSTTTPWPSLLCFSVMHDHNEHDLIVNQLKHRVGIFSCDCAIVISNKRVLIGHDEIGKPIHTWLNPAPNNRKGKFGQRGVTTNSWLNTETFMHAFSTLIKDSQHRIWKHDWLVKADPDCVLFPSRLRSHLRMHRSDGSFFFANCNNHGPKLYGSLEVYSKTAMRTYAKRQRKCMKLNWHGWGEDTYMQNCMESLGVQRIIDYELVGDRRCHYTACSDHARAAFHPFKDVRSWFNCWHASAGHFQ